MRSTDCLSRFSRGCLVSGFAEWAKIAKAQTRLNKLEIKANSENVFVERFSRLVGLQELTRELVDELTDEIRIYAADQAEIVLTLPKNALRLHHSYRSKREYGIHQCKQRGKK